MKPKYIFFDVFGTVLNVRQEFRNRGVSDEKVHKWFAAYAKITKNYTGLNFEYALLNIWDEDKLGEYDLFIKGMMCAAPYEDAVGMKNLFDGRTIALSNASHNLFSYIQLTHHLFELALSSTDFGAFKPDPKVYLGACKHLLVEPSEVLMVASHEFDLRGASACGLPTALVKRPGEDRYDGKGKFDIVVNDFQELRAAIA